MKTTIAETKDEIKMSNIQTNSDYDDDPEKLSSFQHFLTFLLIARLSSWLNS